MLKQRIITALVLVGFLALTFYFLPMQSLQGIFAIVILLAAKEWAKLSLVKTEINQWLYALALGVFVYYCERFVSASFNLIFLQIMTLVWASIIIYLLFVIKRIPKQTALSLPWLIAGIFVLTAAYFALSQLLIKFDDNRLLLFLLIAVVWVTDSGAYLVGKTIGKHKFSPVVSPGKTWQGVAGGVILSGIYGFFIAPYFVDESPWGFVLLILIASWFSVFGDLLESVIKRQSGYKDSGKILPGHGGILDRIDSMLSYTPVIVVGLFYV